MKRSAPFLHVDENIDINTGLEYWFTPPQGGKPAKAYKQFLITLSAIFPLTIVIPWLLQPLFLWLPTLDQFVIHHLVVAAGIVATVTYVVMPRYTRLVSRWLHS